MMSFFIVSHTWNAHLSPPCPAEWMKTNLVNLPTSFKGPTSGTVHYGGPGGPGTSGWCHGTKTIMMRLVWAWAQRPCSIASHPILYFFVVIHFQKHRPPLSCFIYHVPVFPSTCFSFCLLRPSLSLSWFIHLSFPKTLLFLPGTQTLISWAHMHFKRSRRLLVPSWRIEQSSRGNIKTLFCSLSDTGKAG